MRFRVLLHTPVMTEAAAPIRFTERDFRVTRPGFERLEPGQCVPRHAHLSAYVSIVLGGWYEQASYAGRMELRPGDVLVQPMLDRHESRAAPAVAPDLLRLAWFADPGVGGVHRPEGLDAVIRAADRDPREASELLREMIGPETARPPLQRDWPDLLAAELRSARPRIDSWARANGLARETVSRGFRQVFGVSPRDFAIQYRDRKAWIRIASGDDRLSAIAADLGYADQSHMTRAIGALTGAPPARWRRRLLDDLGPCPVGTDRLWPILTCAAGAGRS
jgi:AraC-like DNA-binding protein